MDTNTRALAMRGRSPAQTTQARTGGERRRSTAWQRFLFGMALGSGALSAATGSPAHAISDGSVDASGPSADAVVQVLSDLSCTGTLITPNTVLTAGHCVSESSRGTDNPPHPPAQRLARCPDNWQHAARWYPLGGDHVIVVGRDRLRPTATRVANSYSMTPCADMILLRLTQAVPRSIAIPIPVLANLGDGPGTTDAVRLAGARFEMIGWGQDDSGSIPRLRQRAEGRYFSRTAEKLIPAVDAGAAMQPGDSGSPLLWRSPSGVRYVVGVDQQTGTRPWYTPTFRGPVLDFPPVSALFSNAAPESLYCPVSLLRRPGTVPIGSWWSRGRRDNAVTADRSFAGCHSAIRAPGYAYFRTEGHLFDPNRPRPAGTVPLFRWYSPTRGDNYTTSGHSAAGSAGRPIGSYRFVKKEGYIYKKSLPRPSGTRALYTWYSPSRRDHYTTTLHASRGARGLSLGPDYRFVRLEGYVPIL